MKRYFRSRPWTPRLILLGTSTILSCLVVELACFFLVPAPQILSGGLLPSQYVTDYELGFRPILGDARYDMHGTLREEEGPSISSRPRILFLGDSVAQRGRINRVIQKLIGDSYEYRNAGVESYNTFQEVTHYERYNRGLHPDLIVLLFHPNDFLVVPTISVDSSGHAIASAPGRVSIPISLWWIKHSVIYRIALHSWLSLGSNPQEVVAKSLSRLKSLSIEDNNKLLVVVLPIFDRYENWLEHERLARDQVLNILTNQKICFIDTYPAIEHSAKRTPMGESARDNWHPNDFAATLIGEYVLKNRFFFDPTGGWRLNCS